MFLQILSVTSFSFAFGMQSSLMPNIVCILLSVMCTCVSAGPSARDRITELWRDLANERWTTTQSYWPKRIFPPFTWTEHRGVYASYVHQNYVGGASDTAARNLIAIPDTNAFVTLFVSEVLLDVSEFDPQRFRDVDDLLLSSIDAVSSFQDRNLPPGTPTYMFWPQTSFAANGTTTYRAFSENVEVPVGLLQRGARGVQSICTSLGLKDMAGKALMVHDFVTMLQSSFGIPPDADDTGCALALGAKLHALRHRVPKSWALWSARNVQFESTLSALVEYAYRPFDKGDGWAALIDPRSYFWMHPYLKRLDRQRPRRSTGNATSGAEPVRFVSTWLQNIAGLRRWSKRHVAMPFGVNNVDASVAANALYGVVSGLVHDTGTFAPLFGGAVQAMLLDTARLVAYVIDEDLLNAAEPLVLLYYPSKLNLYWFVARILKVLADPAAARVLAIFASVAELQRVLRTSMANAGTAQILRLASVPDGGEGDVAFWDGFLGDADTRVTATVQLHEDRVYSTAVAANALLDTFTAPAARGTDAKRLRWKPGTPAEVKATTAKAVRWLARHSKRYAPENTFFSASMKGRVSPMNYPANVLQRVNGTAMPCRGPRSIQFADAGDFIVGVAGLMADAEFESQKRKPCAGERVPRQSYDLNAATFPYWSSPALTYAVELHVLVKYANLEAGGDEGVKKMRGPISGVVDQWAGESSSRP